MEYQVETAHGTLFCRREGSGPLLLLIHGVACDSEFFRQASAILSEKFTVISYDRRGYSRSVPAEGETDFSVWAHADDAAEIIRAELERELAEKQQGILSEKEEAGTQNKVNESQNDGVFVAGCSAGGAVTAALATKYPELVRQVFLHEPLMRGKRRTGSRTGCVLGETSQRCRKAQNHHLYDAFCQRHGWHEPGQRRTVHGAAEP